MSINANQNCDIDPNVDQCRWDQCQYSDLHGSALIGIDLHWAVIAGVLQIVSVDLT